MLNKFFSRQSPEIKALIITVSILASLIIVLGVLPYLFISVFGYIFGQDHSALGLAVYMVLCLGTFMYIMVYNSVK